LENLKLFARSMDSAMKPDTSIRYQKKTKDRNRMEDQYRWKIGIDGGIDGRSVEMEDR
jgi:hypothetical protein